MYRFLSHSSLPNSSPPKLELVLWPVSVYLYLGSSRMCRPCEIAIILPHRNHHVTNLTHNSLLHDDLLDAVLVWPRDRMCGVQPLLEEVALREAS